jgi:hypothetical protein
VEDGTVIRLGLSPAPIPPLFSEEAAERAYDEWGCNCGPTALAAICGLTLDEARALLPGFDARRYTNPSMMAHALREAGRASRRIDPTACFPSWGLLRIQWEGPWTQPGVPIKARYRYTHWVGASRRASDGAIGIFDCNQMQNGSGWTAKGNWDAFTAPWIISHIPRASGGWHVTHALEVER